MNVFLFLIIISVITLVWLAYSWAKPFGWRSPLVISSIRLVNLNATIEVKLVGWRRKSRGNRSEQALMDALVSAHHVFAPEAVMYELRMMLDLPRGSPILSKAKDGCWIEIYPYGQSWRLHDIRRSTHMSCDDYVLYAVVEERFADSDIPHPREPKRQLAVA